MSTVQTACPPFMDSQTHRSLQSACLNEAHAQQLYLHAARYMEDAHLHVIAHAFRFTAAQEQEHADILRGLLAHYGGQQPAAGIPLLLPENPAEILRAVLQAKHETWDSLYPAYAAAAAEEGYPRIAGTFLRIAETEQRHAQRFLQYLEALSECTLFRSEKRTSWFCLPCGQLHTGCEAPAVCSGCGKDRGHFIRSSFYPFAVEG